MFENTVMKQLPKLCILHLKLKLCYKLEFKHHSKVVQEESAEMHKEPGDKDTITNLLVNLSGDVVGECLW